IDAIEAEAALELRLQLLVLRFRLGFAADAAFVHFAEIGAGAEAASLARSEYDALELVVLLDRVDDLVKIADHRSGDRVHGAARHVEGDERDAVAVDVDLEVFHRTYPLLSFLLVLWAPIP